MATFYVDGATGNDGNAGTLAAPKATIAAGVSTAAATDTVLVKGGQTYAETSQIAMKAGQRLEQWDVNVTSRPVIDASGIAAASAILVDGVTTVAISDLVIDDAQVSAVYLQNNVTGFTCTRVESNDALVDAFGMAATAAGSVSFAKCRANRPGRTAGGSGFVQAGSVTLTGWDLIVEDADQGTGASAAFESADTGSMNLDSVLSIASADAFKIAGTGTHSIEDAFAINCLERVVTCSGGTVTMNGLVGDYGSPADEAIHVASPGDLTVMNATIVHRESNAGSSQMVYASNSGSVVTLYNCFLVSHSTSSTFRMLRSSGGSLTVKNCISLLLGTGLHTQTSASSTDDFDYNCYFGGGASATLWNDGTADRDFATWQTNTSMDANSFYDDPKTTYVEHVYGQLTLGRLMPGSPCIGTGVNLYPTVFDDAVAGVRATADTAPWDMGPMAFRESDYRFNESRENGFSEVVAAVAKG